MDTALEMPAVSDNTPLAPPAPRTFVVQPRTPANRELVVPRFVPGTRDPVLARRKSKLGFGSLFIGALVSTYTVYALGYLPQADAFFSNIDAYLRSQNDTIVAAIVAAAPYIGIALLFGAAALFYLLRCNRARARAGRSATA